MQVRSLHLAHESDRMLRVRSDPTNHAHYLSNIYNSASEIWNRGVSTAAIFHDHSQRIGERSRPFDHPLQLSYYAD